MGSPRVIGPGGVVHASGPPRLDVWKLEKQKKIVSRPVWCLVRSFLWFCCQISRFLPSSSPLRLGRTPSSTDFSFHRCHCHWFSLPAARIHKSHRVIPASSTVTFTSTSTSATSCTPSFLSPWSSFTHSPSRHGLHVRTFSFLCCPTTVLRSQLHHASSSPCASPASPGRM
jgi:hypothetical protein